MRKLGIHMKISTFSTFKKEYVEIQYRIVMALDFSYIKQNSHFNHFWMGGTEQVQKHADEIQGVPPIS